MTTAAKTALNMNVGRMLSNGTRYKEEKQKETSEKRQEGEKLKEMLNPPKKIKGVEEEAKTQEMKRRKKETEDPTKNEVEVDQEILTEKNEEQGLYNVFDLFPCGCRPLCLRPHRLLPFPQHHCLPQHHLKNPCHHQHLPQYHSHLRARHYHRRCRRCHRHIRLHNHHLNDDRQVPKPKSDLLKKQNNNQINSNANLDLRLPCFLSKLSKDVTESHHHRLAGPIL